MITDPTRLVVKQPQTCFQTNTQTHQRYKGSGKETTKNNTTTGRSGV